MIRGRTKKFFIYGDIVVLLLIPLAIIALRRQVRTATPRLALIQDMDKMPYGKPQNPSFFFADGRIMRPHIPGTLARQDFDLPNPTAVHTNVSSWKNDHVIINTKDKFDRIMLGQVISGGQGAFLKRIPIPVTSALLKRGQGQFDIFCAPCHGYNGRGNGMVNRYVDQLRSEGDPAAGTWVQPSDLTGPGVQYMPVGGIYNVITNGLAAMAAYKDQIPVMDRWAIVAYVNALGLSRKVVPADRFPPAARAKIRRTEIGTTP